MVRSCFPNKKPDVLLPGPLRGPGFAAAQQPGGGAQGLPGAGETMASWQAPEQAGPVVQPAQPGPWKNDKTKWRSLKSCCDICWKTSILWIYCVDVLKKKTWNIALKKRSQCCTCLFWGITCNKHLNTSHSRPLQQATSPNSYHLKKPLVFHSSLPATICSVHKNVKNLSQHLVLPWFVQPKILSRSAWMFFDFCQKFMSFLFSKNVPKMGFFQLSYFRDQVRGSPGPGAETLPAHPPSLWGLGPWGLGGTWNNH